MLTLLNGPLILAGLTQTVDLAKVFYLILIPGTLFINDVCQFELKTTELLETCYASIKEKKCAVLVIFRAKVCFSSSFGQS